MVMNGTVVSLAGEGLSQHPPPPPHPVLPLAPTFVPHYIPTACFSFRPFSYIESSPGHTESVWVPNVTLLWRCAAFILHQWLLCNREGIRYLNSLWLHSFATSVLISMKKNNNRKDEGVRLLRDMHKYVSDPRKCLENAPRLHESRKVQKEVLASRMSRCHRWCEFS